jgi:hypothetical protein
LKHKEVVQTHVTRANRHRFFVLTQGVIILKRSEGRPFTMSTNVLDVILQDDWQRKFRGVCERIAFFSVNYMISLVLMVLLYPLSQEVLAPLLSSVVPISHTSLPKAMMVMTVMYWLPILFDTIKRWRRNTL